MRHLHPVPERDAKPAPVCVYTLGEFRVARREEPPPEPTAATPELALLKVLVALGGESVTVRQLADALWPTLDGAAASVALASAVRALRRWLGRGCVTLRKGRLSLSAEYCWVDAIEFATKATRADRARLAGDQSLAADLFGDSLQIYRGQFLPGEASPTELLSARAHLHGMFIRTVSAFADLLRDDAWLDEAETVLRVALEVDPLSEPLIQRLLRCLLELNRFSDAEEFFERSDAAHVASAGVPLSAETRSIYRSAQSRRSSPPDAPNHLAPPDRVRDRAAAYGDSALGERRLGTVVCVRFDVPAQKVGNDEKERDRILWNLRAEALAVAVRSGGSLQARSSNEVETWYGLSEARDDDPRRAARAVLTLRDDLAASQGALPDDARIRLTAGIATGVVEMKPGRWIGTDVPGGDLSIRASTLAAGAQWGQVLADPRTWELVRDYFAGGDVPAPGAGLAGSAHEVRRAVPVATRFEVSLQRGLFPFVGRDWELETLQDSMHLARQGTGQFVTVVGEAGIGKTRLVHQFRQSIDRTRYWIAEGRCPTDGMESLYAPLVQFIRHGMLLDGKEDADTLHREAVQRIVSISPALEPCVPLLLHLLAIPSDQYPLPEGLHGMALRQAFEDAIVQVIVRTAEIRPLVLILEDWQWADEGSDAALYALLRQLPSARLLVVVIHRAGFQPKWGEVDNHRVLRLGPLTRDQSGRLLRSVVSADALPKELEDSVHQRTHGNPLFVEELGMKLVTELAADLAGAASVTPGSSLPDTIDAVLRDRIDRLDAHARDVLRVASVAGLTVDVEVLEDVVPHPHRVRSALHRLVDQGLLEPIRLHMSPVRYAFKHALVREVAYGTLLPEEQRELHARVGTALEWLYAGELEKHYEVLANHFSQSPNIHKALHYLERSGDKARRQHAVGTARNFYLHALRIATGPGVHAAEALQSVDLAIKLAEVSVYSPSQALLDHIQLAKSIALNLGDTKRIVAATQWLGRVHYIRGELFDARRYLEESLALAGMEGDEAQYARSLAALGRLCVYLPDHTQGIRYMKQGIPLLEHHGDWEETSYASHVLGLHYGMIGDFATALRHAERAVQLAEGHGLQSRRPMAYIQHAWLLGVRGEFANALRCIARAPAISQKFGDVYSVGIGAIVLGWLRFMTGEPQEGLAEMNRGIQVVENAGSTMALTQWHGVLGSSHALLGNLADARRHAQAAIAIGQGGQRHGECIAHRALAITAGMEGDAAAAEQHMADSLGLAQKLNERPYAALSRMRYAQLLLNLGDRERSIEQSDLARREFEAMGMSGWLPYLPS